MPNLETERLLIRPFTLDDLDAAHALFDVHRDVWHFDPGHARTREERAKILRYRILQYENEGIGMMAVTLKADGTLLGYCGLQIYILPTEPHATPEVELFYKFGREFWGQGYATEACRAMIHHAFHDHRLARLVTVTHRDNAHSIALLQRLGMRVLPAPPAWCDDVLGILDNPSA